MGSEQGTAYGRARCPFALCSTWTQHSVKTHPIERNLTDVKSPTSGKLKDVLQSDQLPEAGSNFSESWSNSTKQAVKLLRSQPELDPEAVTVQVQLLNELNFCLALRIF